MIEVYYKLFSQRTAENIRTEVSRLRDVLLFGSKNKVHKFGKVDIKSDIYFVYFKPPLLNYSTVTDLAKFLG